MTTNISASNLAPLKRAKTFQDKVEALIDYLYIGTVYCITNTRVNSPITSTKRKFKIESINIKSATPSYITNFTNTAWSYLIESFDKMIISNVGFYNVRKILIDCKEICHREFEKYDLSDEYTFEAIHSVSIVSNNKVFPAFFENMMFSPEQLQDLRNHCKVRSAFLKRLWMFIDNRLMSYINMPELKLNSYEWDSPNKEIEITELLYSLMLSGRIKIKAGTEDQLRELFFNFFGLHDIDYSKKTHDIRRRVKKSIFLSHLAEQIEKTYTKD